MTREELIKNLKYTTKKHEHDRVDTFDTNISLMCKDVLDYLEQEPKWIPVSEELPKKDESVLLTICANSSLYGFNENFVKVMCGSYNPCEDKRDWIVNEIRYYIDNVIAWMPLPKPYEPQERSE